MEELPVGSGFATREEPVTASFSIILSAVWFCRSDRKVKRGIIHMSLAVRDGITDFIESCVGEGGYDWVVYFSLTVKCMSSSGFKSTKLSV